jgi:hypothetical protein
MLQLPHPNERGSLKRYCAPLTQGELDQVRGFLRASQAARPRQAGNWMHARPATTPLEPTQKT